MRLLTFTTGNGERLGAETDKGVVDLTASGAPALASMQALIEGGDAALGEAKSVADDAKTIVSPGSFKVLAPLPRPAQIRDCLCFEEHLVRSYESGIKVMTMNAEDPAAAEAEFRANTPNTMLDTFRVMPIYYKANRFAVCGPETDVIWPSYSQIMDYELEMACVIGKKARDVPKEDAHDYIFGYSVFNDFSARDAQMLEMRGMLGPCKGKDFDNANGLGPVIVTADEIGDPYNLRMTSRVNGETICDNSSSTMYWKFSDLIAHISRGETIYPGELLCSGTVGGGSGMENLKPLNDGDVVELEIEKIGVLRNRVLRG